MKQLTVDGKEVNIYGMDDFKLYVEKIERGYTLEITEELFNYWLNVLPPVWMRRNFTFKDGLNIPASFAFAEGSENLVIFWRDGKKFFARKSNILNI